MNLHRIVRVLAAQLWLVAAGFAVPAGVQAGPFTSENRDVLLPNTGTWDPAGVTLSGTTFRNLGLQGVGRIAASAKDPATRESLGSISDMQIANFVNNGNGTWSGTLNFLPDRGFNSGSWGSRSGGAARARKASAKLEAFFSSSPVPDRFWANAAGRPSAGPPGLSPTRFLSVPVWR